jgi:hypothetical protein
VDHDHAAGIYLHVVASAGDNRRGTCRDAVDDDSLGTAEAFDRVVDGDASVKVAAAAVDLDQELYDLLLVFPVGVVL